MPGCVGVKMLDDDKGHAAVDWHVTYKLLQRFKATRRGADANNREGAQGCRGGGCDECWLVCAGRLYLVWHGRLFSIYYFLLKWG
jgi:hypothetical protein